MLTLEEKLDRVDEMDVQIDTDNSQWKYLIGLYRYSDHRLRVTIRLDVNHHSQSAGIIDYWNGDGWQEVAILLPNEFAYNRSNYEDGLGSEYYHTEERNALLIDAKKLLRKALLVIMP